MRDAAEGRLPGSTFLNSGGQEQKSLEADSVPLAESEVATLYPAGM